MDDPRSFLATHGRFLLLGHVDPDADCIGSQLALCSWLRRLGKQALCLSDGPFEWHEIRAFAGRFVTDPEDPRIAAVLGPGAAVVLVDCSSLARAGSVARVAEGLPSLVIDHHASGEPFGDVRLVDEHAASTSLLVLRLMEAHGMQPTAEEAQQLLLGFCTDTGFFRHLDESDGPVLVEVSRLLAAGASPQRAFWQIYGDRDLSQTRLLGRLLSRTESHAGGRVLLTWVTQADMAETGGSARGLAELYQHLQMVKGCEVVVLIKEESATECSVSLRSSNDYDVGRLAQSLGGGGHRPAAGYAVAASVAEARRTILERLLLELPPRG